MEEIPGVELEKNRRWMGRLETSPRTEETIQHVVADDGSW